MITFKDLSDEDPYIEFKRLYDKAIALNQENIEVASISSYSPKNNEVDSRLVNIKFLDDKDFIFFSNYNSPKAQQFRKHNQISVVIFWPSINIQIRIKANIRKASQEYSNNYFKTRNKNKNALSISSNQSKEISSFKKIKSKYDKVFKTNDLSICPDYWGGFLFTPYYFEFWEGNKNRLNKREAYKLIDNIWEKLLLQP